MIPKRRQIEKKLDYSMEEQVVGKWLDGKNLYRKTITINALKYGEEMILSQISNADSIFVKNSYVINSTSGYTTSVGTYYPTTNRESRIWADAKAGYIKCFLGTGWQNIVNQLVSQSINTLIIGKNDGWKQETNIGNVNNQNFVNIPH